VLHLRLFGQAIVDNGGTLRTATGTQVGTIDYQTGRIVWTNAIGSGNATQYYFYACICTCAAF
jgi:hypothetical protein